MKILIAVFAGKEAMRNPPIIFFLTAKTFNGIGPEFSANLGPPLDKPSMASPTHDHGMHTQAIRPGASQSSHNHGRQTQAIRQRACQPLMPANSAWAGTTSQVSSSSSNASSPFSFSDWTIKQIHEFVSIDSLSRLFMSKIIQAN